MDSIPGARFKFAGPVEMRIEANVEDWLLRAPSANPGMLEMFRIRDRKPVPNLVPWAGEFVGKYLISAVQALRMTRNPRLEEQVKSVVEQLIATQADDGYLGPFPKNERLLKHWDLWGHYHALLALTLWAEYGGSPEAVAAARRAADLVCTTYLSGERRVIDAGDHEMNMTILTGIAIMHRLTHESRYLQMAREVEKDWEKAGDYLSTGLNGTEFFQTPRPRWESLHDLQGLVELWRITGEDRYRTAFLHHWRSICRWDRRNTGGFSSGEQATGNPFAPTAIETCCTVAWMAVTLDYLKLTGDPIAVDELELSMLNAGLGAQHPSGRWWTYNTPMDGAREASAHSIVFQARAGTPELNCCSVNGPRVLGVLSEWAVMAKDQGLVVNWLGAGRSSARLPDSTLVTITSSSDAWLDGGTEWRVDAPAGKMIPLQFRVPSWARNPTWKLNGELLPGPAEDGYVRIERAWQPDDRLIFNCELPIRFVAGAKEADGRVSLYRGPLLLAYDQSHNDFDEGEIPPVDLERLDESAVVDRYGGSMVQSGPFRPWVKIQVPTVDGRRLMLVDFASAGAAGTRYRSWLAPAKAPAPPLCTIIPKDGERLVPGNIRFSWQPASSAKVNSAVQLAKDPRFREIVTSVSAAGGTTTIDLGDIAQQFGPDGRVYWRVVSSYGRGRHTEPNVPPASFLLDSSARPQPRWYRGMEAGPNREVIVHSLRKDDIVEYGRIESENFSARSNEGTELNGRDQKITYATAWPAGDFGLTIKATIKRLPVGRLGQIFCAWCEVADDPLRIVVDEGKLYVRVESGLGQLSTSGILVDPGKPYAIAVSKRGTMLTLFVNGMAAGSLDLPIARVPTKSNACAIGGNPRFSGDEHLAGRFSDFRLYERALTEDEIRIAAEKP